MDAETSSPPAKVSVNQPAKEPPFFNVVDFQNAPLTAPCTTCGDPTNIVIIKHRGARAWKPMPYCLIHAIALKYSFLEDGTLIRQQKPEMFLKERMPFMEKVGKN